MIKAVIFDIDGERKKERFDIQWVASKNRQIHDEVLRLLKA